MGYTHTNPLRHAMATLHAQDPQGWIRAVADEVVRLGGGDAVDLMLLALDDALEEAERDHPDDP